MADRSKPVDLAKRLKVRPQIIYGLIKRGKVKTFDNPAGGAQLVDDAEVTMAVARMAKRGPRREKSHTGGKKPPKGIARGTIITHAHAPIKGAFARPNGGGERVKMVYDPGRGGNSLVWLSDGTVETFYDTERLADKLKKGVAKIESVPTLLGMICFQWREKGHPEWAESLEAWAKTNRMRINPVVVPDPLPPYDDEPEQTDDTSHKETVWKEVELGVDLNEVEL